MPHSTAADRRRFLECFAGLGLSSTLFPGVLWAQLQQSRTSRITKVMLHDAAAVAGMTFTERELDAMLEAVNLNVGRLDEILKARRAWCGTLSGANQLSPGSPFLQGPVENRMIHEWESLLLSAVPQPGIH